MNNAINSEPINWNKIYFDIQASGIPDPRFQSKNFPKQAVWVIREMLERINHRDMVSANSLSISAAKIGLAFAPKNTPLQYFLPFDLSDDINPSKVSQSTANIFMQGVRDNIIPSKVIGAFSSQIEYIQHLTR